MFAFDFMESYLFPSFMIVMALIVVGIGALAMKGGK